MAGYRGFSMSNNAVDAYNSGEKPFSKWTIGEITVQVWGGTRKHPKIIGYDTQKGIVKGDFLYFDGGRYKITAHKVVSFKIISD